MFDFIDIIDDGDDEKIIWLANLIAFCGAYNAVFLFNFIFQLNCFLSG